jgi:hypothetical protein
MKQAGLPRPAPGAQATGIGRPAIAGTSAVIAAESVFQGPAGEASQVAAGATAAVADMAGPFPVAAGRG